jgi:hypothetical protein
MDLTPAELRHGIRGTLNALKLCVSAFEMPLETSEKLEFLSDIETSADKLIDLLLRLQGSAPEPAAERAAESGHDTPVAIPLRTANVR